MNTPDTDAPPRVGIIAAMRQEINLLLEHLEGREEREHAGRAYVTGRLAGREAALVAAGIGKVYAAMAAQSLIDLFNCRAILCIGMGGGLEPGLEPGDVVIATEAAQFDYDLSGGSTLMSFFVDRVGATLVRCDETLAARARAAAERYAAGLAASERPPRVLAGRILTGDTPVFKKEKKDALYAEFGGLCVEMEGAAVGRVCAANGVPFAVIRAISDRAEGFAMLEFKKSLARVAPVPQQIALSMLREEQRGT